MAIMVKAPPFHSESDFALSLIKQLVKDKHPIECLFFYGEGVYHGQSQAVALQGQHQSITDWQALIQTHSLNAIVCITAALKRGIIDTDEMQRYNKEQTNLAPGLTLGGLGQWVDAVNKADQHLIFG
ncbi:MAG: sulfurtransferase complex subunit TusD [Cellvibrionales bacterium]|nr:sulfurtransferase complex subunit TusD [Cellvibrionales bacterium]